MNTILGKILFYTASKLFQEIIVTHDEDDNVVGILLSNSERLSDKYERIKI